MCSGVVALSAGLEVVMPPDLESLYGCQGYSWPERKRDPDHVLLFDLSALDTLLSLDLVETEQQLI